MFRFIHFWCFFICFFCLFLANGFSLDGEGEEEFVKMFKENPQVAMKEALTNKSDSIAANAYGTYLKETKDFSSPELAKFFLKFSQRSDMEEKAIYLMSQQSCQALIPVLIEMGEEEYAAKILACQALTKFLEMDNRASLKAPMFDHFGVEVDMKKIKTVSARSQKKKGKKKSVASSSQSAFPIPAVLFESRDESVLYHAVCAAAYSKSSEYQDAVSAIEKSSKDLDGISFLYHVLIGKIPTAEEVEGIIKRCKSVSGALRSNSPVLASYAPRVPGMCSVMEALGYLPEEDYLEYLYEGLDHSDLRVRIEAARSLKKVGNPSSASYLAKEVDKAPWPLLVSLCEAIAAHPHVDAVEPVIKRLHKEEGRFRLDLTFVLTVIKGSGVGSTDPDEWEDWWKENKKTFQIDPKASAEVHNKLRPQDAQVEMNGMFYNIGIFSDRCCFVVDTSASMKRNDRIGSLRKNLSSTIKLMKSHVYFNLVDFGGDVVTLAPGKLIRDKNTTIKRVQEMPLTYATRSFDAIEKAYMMKDLDTVYFLSDGAPVRGQLDPWPKIITTFTFLNRYRPIAISMVDFDPSEGNQLFMILTSHKNFGHHDSIDVMAQ